MEVILDIPWESGSDSYGPYYCTASPSEPWLSWTWRGTDGNCRGFSDVCQTCNFNQDGDLARRSWYEWYQQKIYRCGCELGGSIHRSNLRFFEWKWCVGRYDHHCVVRQRLRKKYIVRMGCANDDACTISERKHLTINCCWRTGYESWYCSLDSRFYWCSRYVLYKIPPQHH